MAGLRSPWTRPGMRRAAPCSASATWNAYASATCGSRAAVQQVRDAALTERSRIPCGHHSMYGWSPIVAIPITGMTCGTPASRSHVEASRTNDSRAALSKKYRRWNVFSATRLRVGRLGRVAKPVTDQDLAHPAGQHFADAVAAVKHLAQFGHGAPPALRPVLAA